MKYLKLFENFNLGLRKLYHISSKDQLNGLLSGIKTDKAGSWGQGSGMYVSTSEKWCEEQEGVGSRYVDLMIELETEMRSDNFDMDYENLPDRFVNRYIDTLKNMFDKNFVISSGENFFLIFGNNIDKNDFDFQSINFRNEIIGEIPKSSKEDWCYLPINRPLNGVYSVKIVNNIYGAPLTKDFIERLDKFGLNEKIKKDLFESTDPVALRYIGSFIKPVRYKVKENGKWGKWIRV